jgi:hypothetical protein
LRAARGRSGRWERKYRCLTVQMRKEWKGSMERGGMKIIEVDNGRGMRVV